MFSLLYSICTTLIFLNIHKYTVYKINRSGHSTSFITILPSSSIVHKKEESNKLQKCYIRAQTHFLSLYFCSPVTVNCVSSRKLFGSACLHLLFPLFKDHFCSHLAQCYYLTHTMHLNETCLEPTNDTLSPLSSYVAI